MVNYLDIYGEYHSDEDRDRIESLILIKHFEIHYDYILTEEAGHFSYYTNKEKQKAIDEEVTSIGTRSFELGIKMGIPVVGIDQWDIPGADKLSLAMRFKVREARMLKVIAEYHKKGNVAVIVGDSHLRTIKTKELGDVSVLNIFSKREGVVIVRSPIGEI